MTSPNCIIIGGSHAAAQLAPSLRQAGWDGKITIISDDSAYPYHRPPLSKAYLDGSIPAEKLLIRTEKFYQNKDIDIVLNTRVTAINRDDKTVSLSDGQTLSYDKLALTTGAAVRKIPLPGADLKGVHYLRDMADVTAIKADLDAATNAVIIGGGYIGLETAASLRKLGKNVTILEAMPRVLQRVTTEEISAFYTRVHTEEGVNIITDAAASELVGNGSVEAVCLKDGTRIEAELVVIGVGVIPATKLAEDAGLEVGNGIIVDEYARTSDHDIVAAGDCTFHHNPIYNTELRLESVQNATDQAKTAAAAICGQLQPYSALPWFWSDQYDLKLQIAGLSQGFDEVIIRGDIEGSRSFAAFYLKDGKLLAVDAINKPKEFMMCRKMLADGAAVDASKLADDAIDIKDAFIV